MNVPLKWLSQYVQLPKKVSDLTHKLTMVGHMLDKTKELNGDTVIDLELRGNRADMFGLIGVARDVSAIFDTPLILPPTTPLTPKESKSSLLKVEPSASSHIKRYIAVKLSVKVAPSPAWLVDSLKSYGIEPINNVVDITNYCMVESSHPMHAFDADLLSGGKLVLRSATSGEKFSTIQQGTVLSLSTHDLAICDDSSVQGLTTIGGLKTKVTENTTSIILETAVYDAASSRRTARRHKTFTESSLRHEKLQDPNELPFVLERAVYLLQKIAQAKVESSVSDYYPNPTKPTTIEFDPAEIFRLSGLDVDQIKTTKLLTRLGFQVTPHKNMLSLTVPTFRTDVESPSDVVEEVVRLVGYDSIPEIPLSGPMPTPQTYPSFTFQEKVRDILVSLKLNEVITSTMTSLSTSQSLKLINPPDPDTAYLRTSLSPQLVLYAQKLLHQKIESVNLFEIGKVFFMTKNKYYEGLHLSVCIAGNTSKSNWRNPKPKPFDVYDLKGIVSSFEKICGYSNLQVEYTSQNNIFSCEINLENQPLPTQVSPVYSTISQYPPIIEDINLSYRSSYHLLEQRIYKLSPLIKSIELVDKYDNKLTLRITFHSDSKQLSKEDISPLREKIMALD